jgi:hypothetical protein
MPEPPPNLRSTIMTQPRNVVYVLVAACSLALAACQPNDEPAPRSMKSLDSAATKIVAQIDSKPAEPDATK